MGIHGSNTYALRVPMTQIGNITTAYREMIKGDWHHLPDGWEHDTPEALVDMILATCGSDTLATTDDFGIEGSDLVISTSTFGKVHDVEMLVGLLAHCEVTGTIESEIEGQHYLIDIKDGESHEYRGVVTYPGYEAS